MTRPTESSNDLLERGMQVSCALPRCLVPEARRMVSLGLFGSLGEFCFIAVTTYLDLIAAAPLHEVVLERLPVLDAGSEDQGDRADTLIPGHMAVRIARLVADGAYADPDAFFATAMSAYLVLREDGDLLAALDTATVHAALERPNMPFSHAVAAFTNRLRRLPPLSPSEAMASIGWTGATAA